MNRSDRARMFAALGDEERLAIAEGLLHTDMTFSEVVEATGLEGNLLAYHLGVLEEAGAIRRTVSESDRRRRYLSLDPSVRRHLDPVPLDVTDVLFVCSHNSARSQYAAGWWATHIGTRVASAGTEPADAVHPLAVATAAERGVDLTEAVPRGYPDLEFQPRLVVSVCDRAKEKGDPSIPSNLHWSVADPVTTGDPGSFVAAFDHLESRLVALTGSR